MKLLKKAFCFMLINGVLLPGYAQVQNPDLLHKEVNGEISQVMAPLKQQLGGVKLFGGSKPVTFNRLTAEVEYNYFQDTSGMGLGAFHNIQGTIGYSAAYGVTLESMPFNMSILENNGINTLHYTPFQSFYKFNFDHTKYVETLRSKVIEKINPGAIMNSALSRVNRIRQNYEQQLRGEVGQIQGDFSKEYKSALTLLPLMD